MVSKLPVGVTVANVPNPRFVLAFAAFAPPLPPFATATTPETFPAVTAVVKIEKEEFDLS